VREDPTIGSMAPGCYGAPGQGALTLREIIIARAWNVQGDCARSTVEAAVRERFGVALPREPNTTAANDRWMLLWLGPTSWLAVAAAADSASDPSFNASRDALNAAGAALFDVSAARAGWTLAGPRAATVLAKACPLDFDARAFPTGGCAQSVYGHINALYYRQGSDTFTMLVSSSYRRDAWHALCVSAAQYGYEVLPPQAV